jgi:glycosyltransferase involved in cell wall biosynthesis
MRVLHVIAAMDPTHGGVCQAVRTIIAGLDTMGAHSEVVSLDDPKAPFLALDTFLIHALGPTRSPWQYHAALLPWLIENSPRFDAILLHGLWLYPGYAVHKALRVHQRRWGHTSAPKLFIMPHGMLDPYFQRASGRKIKAARNWIYWKLIENKVVNQADGVLFTCEEERRLAAKPFRPYHPKQEFIVGLGVEEPPAYTARMRDAFLKECPQVEGHAYYLFLSRINEKKGVELLIKAYAALRGTSTGPHAPETEAVAADNQQTAAPHLVVAGPGLNTSYGQALVSYVATELTLQQTVSFPGMLTGEAKWGAFYGCEAFVLPSHQENFGIAVVEALACGKPVLISNQVNIWREINAAGGGFVAEDTQEGTQELLEQWEQLSRADKQEMGQKARNCFQVDFAVPPIASRMLNALSSR